MMKRIWPAAFALAVGLSCLDAPAGVPSAAKGIVWSDDFSKPGAPAPGWEGDVFVWCARDGRLEGSWLNSAFAFPPPRMLYHAVSAEVLATPQKANGKSWKIAALAMVQDERNFWHLGLVEKPDAAGSGHFVELCEMRDGHWLSQHNLKSTVYRGNDLAWKYGQAYRLRIALTPQGVTGTVSAPDGRELTRIGFAFTGRAVAAARPALRVIAMSAAFDDFRMEAAPAGAQPIPKPPEKTFPPYAVKGSGVRAPGRATGFFRVARVGDRHWLVDPRGELFFAVGTDHVNYYAHWCQKLGYAPYNRFCQKKYGLVERWAESAAARLRAWGFNLLGAGNIEPVRYHGLAHTLFAAFGSSFAGYSALVEKVHWTGFPNVFDPLWPAYCEARAKKLCAPNGKDPWLLGYFLDNELEWWGKEHTPTGIFTDTMKWPRDHSGKRALVDFLRRQHGSIAEFNRVWKQHIASWDELLGMMRLPAATDEARAIQHRFIARVADRYFTVATRAIRKYDPNHLVIGCRFAGNAPEEAWKGCARTCDVVTFNHYPRIDFESGDLSGLAAVFEKYHALTQRPMMITEWSFPALDAQGDLSKHPCFAIVIAETDTIQACDFVCAPFRLRQAQFPIRQRRRRTNRGFGGLIQAFEHLNSALDLARFRVLGSKALDKTLDLTTATVRVAPGRLRLFPTTEPGCRIGIVIARIACDRPPQSLQSHARQAVQEEAIMRNQQESPGKVTEEPTQPFDGRDIQVVRGFIEQQDIRIGNKGTCQFGTHLPAAAEFRKRSTKGTRGKPQAAQHGLGTISQTIASKMLEPVLQIAETKQLGVMPCPTTFGQPSFEFCQSLFDALQFRHGILCVFQ